MSFDHLTTAELEAKLAELETALDKIMTGTAVSSVGHEGSSVEFRQIVSDRVELQRRIARMRTELARRRGSITAAPQLYVRG